MSDVLSSIDRDRLPAHVAVIMDGNGRWAKARGLPRTEGHRAGEQAMVDAVDGALEVGLRWLTVYAFSTENWKRPPEEVRFLMGYNRDLLRRRRQEFLDKGVRVRFIGRRNERRLPRSVVRMAEETEELTAGCRELNLTIALNYGGRAEIVDSVRHLAELVARGEIEPDRIRERDIARHMYEPDLPDPDVIVRTSGEFRTSNYLLWQGAYAELVFTPVLWPDFTRRDLWEAIAEYQRRSRRFGGVD
ncbi:MAG TPA: polyprenyl diphosphate synthase [Actinomycetota bacterium]|jgi:undecaprenyl diphosphate synthase|nr:polyprenyl diphosphate synthase [Actinomycetota bacterium]